MDGGLNFLIPQPYEVAWTALKDGTFSGRVPFLPTEAFNNPDALIASTIPITAQTSGMILAQNSRRRLLIIQNNSTATSPDTAPVIWFNFGQVAIPGRCAGLQPGGGGVLFDRGCPINAVYITVGPSVGTSPVVQGTVLEGSMCLPDV